MHETKFQTALRIFLSKSWNLLINILKISSHVTTFMEVATYS